MYHTDHDDADAAKKAMEYLQNSMYKDQLPTAGLYYAQLVDRSKALKGLTTPKLGDSLLKPDGTAWMSDLQKMAPKLNWDDLTQSPALPLGSWLKTDPWDDKVHMLNAKRYAPMNARDKLPFEVTPIFYKLQRYDVTHLDTPTAGAAAAPATAAPATAAPAGDQPAADQPAGGQPAGDQPAGGQPTGDQPAGAQPTGDQPATTPGASGQSNPPADQPAAGDTNTTPQQPPASAPNPQ
jgi:hypothetical protein